MAEWIVPLLIVGLLGAIAFLKGRVRLVLIGLAIQIIGVLAAGVIEGLDPSKSAADVAEPVYRLSSLAGLVVMLVGVFGLARPDSPYARRFYGEEKLTEATLRYAEGEEERDEASERRTARSFSFVCQGCGEAFETETSAITHVNAFHSDRFANAEDGVEPA